MNAYLVVAGYVISLGLVCVLAFLVGVFVGKEMARKEQREGEESNKVTPPDKRGIKSRVQ